MKQFKGTKENLTINADSKYGYVRIETESGKEVAILSDGTFDEKYANAELFVAAHELLRSLIFAIDFIEKTPLIRHEDEYPKGLEKWKWIVNKALGDE